jgi:hypothetical protein
MGVMYVPQWSNQDLDLFHGTILSHAQTIIQSGVDVTKSRSDCDFGTGFYCTTAERLARRRALDKSAAIGQPPAIVHLKVPRSLLANLSTLSFVRGERDALDFWSVVHFFRNGAAQLTGITLATLFPYDVAFGPIVLWKTQQPMSRSDQVSFHTEAAQQLLNSIATRSIISV